MSDAIPPISGRWHVTASVSGWREAASRPGGMMGDDAGLYREILDNLYDGVYFVDRRRVVNYWNKGAERISGYSAQEMIGHSCSDHLLNHVNADGAPLCQYRLPAGRMHE